MVLKLFFYCMTVQAKNRDSTDSASDHQTYKEQTVLNLYQQLLTPTVVTTVFLDLNGTHMVFFNQPQHKLHQK